MSVYHYCIGLISVYRGTVVSVYHMELTPYMKVLEEAETMYQV